MKFFWKVYFWVFAFIVVIGYSTTFSDNASIYYYFDIILSIIGLLGLWCYVYERGLLNRGVWQTFFCLFIFWNVIEFIFEPFYSSKEFIDQKMQFYVKLTSVAISLPAYFALFLYGFRSKEIWQKS